MSSALARALATWPIIAAEMVLFGSASFELWRTHKRSYPEGRTDLIFVGLWRWLTATLVVLAPVALINEVSLMAATSWRNAIPLIPEVIRETHTGHMWAIRLPLMLVAAIFAWIIASKAVRTKAICILSAALLYVEALSGHAIDWGIWTTAIYFAHLAAGALWLGFLMGLCVVEYLWWRSPTRADGNDDALRASAILPRVAGTSVAVIAATGFIMAYQTLGLHLYLLPYSAYGRTLMAKVLVFVFVLFVGGYNRYWLVPEAADSSVMAKLARNVGVECGFLFAVIGLAALLANTAPPH